jgi:NADP-dependent 3-hydroxy acid dehydrogenase YdfG
MIELKKTNLQNKEIFENNKITRHFDVTVNMTDNECHEMISIHINGTFFCNREALKIMNEQTQGCIINMV